MKWSRRQDGQALVELALVLPILLILVLGVFEFGRAWNRYQVITDAAREGARVCVVGSQQSWPADTVDKAVQRALNNAGIALPAGQPQVIGYQAGLGTPCNVSITIPFDFVFLGPWVTALAGGPFNMSTTFTMRNE
jgi:Flp pilus assembly protein TadG